MLVACILVNRTTWAQARPVFLHLKRTYRTIPGLAQADLTDLEQALMPLGLYRARSASLRKLASDWLQVRCKRSIVVSALPGCGKYAADSWAIFIEGRLDVQPTDRKLLYYLKHQTQDENPNP